MRLRSVDLKSFEGNDYVRVRRRKKVEVVASKSRAHEECPQGVDVKGPWSSFFRSALMGCGTSKLDNRGLLLPLEQAAPSFNGPRVEFN